LKAGEYFVLVFVLLITMVLLTVNLFVSNSNPLTEKWLFLFFFFEMGALALVIGIFRDWYMANTYVSSIEKKKKEFGEDYLDETVNRFKEKYPDKEDSIPNDPYSYRLNRSFRKVEKEVLEERKFKRFK
jgi:hypothetical protein